jgi:hypothetical protein
LEPITPGAIRNRHLSLHSGVSALDAELVPFGIGENDPPGTVDPKMVGNEARAEPQQAIYFFVASISFDEVDVHAVLPRLPIGHPFEQESGLSSSKRARGLGVARMIVGTRCDAQHLTPPPRQARGIGTVNSDAADGYGHRRIS